MRSVRTAVAVAVGIVVGCGSARYFAPPKLAEAQGSTVTRWDYFCFDGNSSESVEARARAAGVEGWELVGAGGQFGSHWCMKRPLP